MRALIINLSAETERMAFQRTQMAALGMDWERLEAVTPDSLSVPFEAPHWQRWERPMRAVEAAALASHVLAWERIGKRGEPHLVMEDDALLAVEAPAFLRAAEAEAGREGHDRRGGGKRRMDHIVLETYSRKKLVGRRHPVLPLRALYQDMAGAAAYVLWSSGAEKLLARATDRPGPADAVISAAYELDSWQAEPALAIQLFRCAAHGMTPPVATRSAIHTGTSPRGRGVYRLRRIASQLRMGLRYLSKIAMAERREIPVSPNWPSLEMPTDS